MVSLELTSREIAAIARKYLYENIVPEESWTKADKGEDQQPLDFHGIKDSEIEEMAKQIAKLFDQKQSDHRFFFAPSLESEFKKIVPILLSMNIADAAALLKAFKVMAALASKGNSRVSL